MKIVYLNPVGVLGGGERSLLDVIASVRAARPDATMLVIASTDGPLITEAKRLGADAVLLEMSPELAGFGDSGVKARHPAAARAAVAWQAARRAPAGWRYVRQLKQLLADARPDVIHSNGIKTHLLARFAAPAGVPVLWHVRDYAGARPVVAAALRWASSRAAGAIAISRSVADDFRAACPGLPVQTVYNAIDVEHFSPGAPADPNWLDAAAGLAPPLADVVRVGLVATYGRWKGHDVFLDAAARVTAAAPDAPVRFYVVGGPIYVTRGSQFTEAELRGMAEQLGLRDRVAFVPFQRDVAEAFRALDVVVHASTEPEPFGRTIVEAMACGKPVIVSQAGGAAELFAHDQDAVGVAPRDPAALAAAIQRLVTDPSARVRLGRSARETAVRRFGHDRLGREIAAVYDRVAGGRSSK